MVRFLFDKAVKRLKGLEDMDLFTQAMVLATKPL